MYLNNTWHPNMTVIGMDGIPAVADAGNVLRPNTRAKLSVRLPPIMDPNKARDIIVEKLTKDVPFNAKVTVNAKGYGPGWSMKELTPWLDASIKEAGTLFWEGKETSTYGCGGSIPFLN